MSGQRGQRLLCGSRSGVAVDSGRLSLRLLHKVIGGLAVDVHKVGVEGGNNNGAKTVLGMMLSASGCHQCATCTI